VDQRTGLVHDYSKKSGVIDSFLIGWNGSREELWNAAEAAERRKDSATAKTMTIALPHEATPEQRRGAVMEFAAYLRERLGVAVDCALHAPGREDARNYHAHLIFSVRSVDDGKFAPKKFRDLDGAAGLKTVGELRETWAGIVQRIARDPTQWDHRSLVARGIDREATRHRGPNRKENYEENIKRRALRARIKIAEIRARRMASMANTRRLSAMGPSLVRHGNQTETGRVAGNNRSGRPPTPASGSGARGTFPEISRPPEPQPEPQPEPITPPPPPRPEPEPQPPPLPEPQPEPKKPQPPEPQPEPQPEPEPQIDEEELAEEEGGLSM
jgi:hypothetical protein